MMAASFFWRRGSGRLDHEGAAGRLHAPSAHKPRVRMVAKAAGLTWNSARSDTRRSAIGIGSIIRSERDTGVLWAARWRLVVLALSIAFYGAEPSLALAAQQDASKAGQDGSLQGFVTVGVGLIPDYEGSRSYQAIPYLDGRLRVKNYYARFEGGALRFNVIDSATFHAGPLLGFRRGRGDVASKAITRMHHISGSMTAGGFVEYEHVHHDPRAAERLTLTIGDDVTGGDSGWQATLVGIVRRPLSFVDQGFIASFEADMSWSSRSYMQTYFGVTPADAIRSGLPVYSAGAGFKSAGAALAFNQYLSRDWSVGIGLHYAHLMNDAAKSPVTAIAGDPNQYFAGLMVGYAL